MVKQKAKMQEGRTAATAKVIFTQGALSAMHEAVKEEALALAEESAE